MSDNKIQISKISQYRQNQCKNKDDAVAVEAPLEIRLGHDKENFNSLLITMCSPAEIRDLITGYLFCESVIDDYKDIENIEIFDNEFGFIAEVVLKNFIRFMKTLNKGQTVSYASCGICGKTNMDDLLTKTYPKVVSKSTSVSPELILSLTEKLNKNQTTFKKTGGIHASALFDASGELLMIKEDIGRHNALDKLIGASLRQDLLPLSDKIILLSGRVSFELVQKALSSGVSILAAIGAPSSLSVEIAKAHGLCLIGFIKSDAYNIYSPLRISVQD